MNADHVVLRIDREMFLERERVYADGGKELWVRRMREELIRTMQTSFGADPNRAAADLDAYIAASNKDEQIALEELLFEQRFLVAVGETGLFDKHEVAM